MIFLYIYFSVAIVLDHAHLASPIALAWSKPQFRAMMLSHWEWYIMLPLVLIIVSVVIGLEAVSNNRLVPGNGAYWTLSMTYLLWNAWHFGSQHYGVASLLGWRSTPRRVRQIIIIGPTMAIMLLPIGVWPMVIIGEVIGFLHWTTDIGLSVWVMRRYGWLFLLIVISIGFAGFEWKGVTSSPCPSGLPVCTAVWSIPVLISLRYGLGFVHFLYSRWVWKGEHKCMLGY